MRFLISFAALLLFFGIYQVGSYRTFGGRYCSSLSRKYVLHASVAIESESAKVIDMIKTKVSSYVNLYLVCTEI